MEPTRSCSVSMRAYIASSYPNYWICTPPAQLAQAHSLITTDTITMCSTNHDHRFASSNPMCFQPNQSVSRIMDACGNLDRSNGGGQEEAAAGSSDPGTVLTYLTFLEHKIGHLRGILCSTPRPQQLQIVSAELSCIIVQLISVSKSLVAGTGAEGEDDEVDARWSTPSLLFNAAHGLGSDDSDDQDGHHPRHVGGEEEGNLSAPRGSYDVIQIDREEILAPHVHFCKACGKGFKRDANLRMHMRGHGDEYKTAAALAKPPPPASSSSRDAQAPPETPAARRCYYSCPYVGCKRNKDHRDFQPLKTPVCVKNHYRRSHCDKSHTCRRCNVKKFSVLADLRTHEKHCGRDRWVCSCGTSFSRKDKLFAHVALFDGHTPALPPPDETATEAISSGGSGTAVSGQLLPLAGGDAVTMDQCFSDSMFDDLIRCSDIKGSSTMDDDGRGGGFLSPIGLDSCGFDGFDLFGAPAIDFDF